MLVRLATTIDRIDSPSKVGRPRIWPTLIMLEALWHLTRRLRVAAPAERPAAPERVEPALGLAAAGGA
jgi:hypothetical protein